MEEKRRALGDLQQFTRIGNDANPWNSLTFHWEFFQRLNDSYVQMTLLHLDFLEKIKPLDWQISISSRL